MVNVNILWFSLLPILVCAILWNTVPLNSVKDKSIMSGIFFAFSLLFITLAFLISSGVATSDIEIWNGKITSKDRIHDHHLESYECNCRTTTSGSGQDARTTTTCDTCYTDHYTVAWVCNSTLGPYEIDKKDWTSRAVYALPNPARWSSINIGDPAAKRHRYTNYVQAVPESLFKSSPEKLKLQFASLTPAYPDSVYDFYKINRVLAPGHSVPDLADWNNDISMMLRDLGPSKQVNVIVVIAKSDNSNYEFALRDAWEGANKNDVVLVIGSKEYPKIDFVRVISWTKNEKFKIELRDNVQDLEQVNRPEIVKILQAQIVKNFERRHMKDFEYLQNEIDPPAWVLAITAVLIILAGVGVYLNYTGGFKWFL